MKKLLLAVVLSLPLPVFCQPSATGPGGPLPALALTLCGFVDVPIGTEAAYFDPGGGASAFLEYAPRDQDWVSFSADMALFPVPTQFHAVFPVGFPSLTILQAGAGATVRYPFTRRLELRESLHAGYAMVDDGQPDTGFRYGTVYYAVGIGAGCRLLDRVSVIVEVTRRVYVGLYEDFSLVVGPSISLVRRKAARGRAGRAANPPRRGEAPA
jgi:hypothetical protein